MNPYKTRNSYPEIAEQFSLEVEDIKSINQFYWKYIHKQLSNLVNPIILITGLGTMDIKHWRVESAIEKLKKNVKKWSHTKRGSVIYDGYQEDLLKVLQLKSALASEVINENNTNVRKDSYKNEYN